MGGGSGSTTTTMASTTTTITTESKPGSLKFVIVDMIGFYVTGSVTWEKSECAATSFRILPASRSLQNTTIEYTETCGKMMTIAGDSNGKACETFKTPTAQPISTFYVKTKTGAGVGNCEFASNPKSPFK